MSRRYRQDEKEGSSIFETPVRGPEAGYLRARYKPEAKEAGGRMHDVRLIVVMCSAKTLEFLKTKA